MHGRLKQLSVQILAVGCSTADFEVDRADFIYACPKYASCDKTLEYLFKKNDH